jgi:chromosome segregation ATPase
MNNNGNNGEIKKSNGSWQNTVSLKDYFDERFEQTEKALNVASGQMEKRLDSMNEFRESLKDAQATFTTRREHEILIQKYDNQVDELKDGLAEIENTLASVQAKMWIILSIGSAVIAWFALHLLGKF